MTKDELYEIIHYEYDSGKISEISGRESKANSLEPVLTFAPSFSPFIKCVVFLLRMDLKFSTCANNTHQSIKF